MEKIDWYVIIILLLIFYFIRGYRKIRMEEIKLARYQVNLNVPLNTNVDEILQNIINDCLEEYKVLNISHKDHFYINEEHESKIVEVIKNNVADRLSPVVYERLALYYNRDIIPDIIAKTIIITVTVFVVQNNTINNRDITNNEMMS